MEGPHPSSASTLRVFVVSDGTGGTAERALKAAMTQFPGSTADIRMRSGVRGEADIFRIVEEAAGVRGIIVHTLVTDQLRRSVLRAGREHNVETIDLMGALLARLSDHLAVSPSEQPGLFHQLNEQYFHRIETMEFALNHDDGLRMGELGSAEIVLLGVSRTFKTPLSVYLAFKGWFVANVPIVLDLDPPAVLDSIPPERVFCLDTNAPLLSRLRGARAEYLRNSVGEYAQPRQVERELRFARAYFRKHPTWHVVSVAHKPIEEIASEILSVRKRANHSQR